MPAQLAPTLVSLYQGTALAGPQQTNYDSGFSPWAALKKGLRPKMIPGALPAD
jgi:hypothetical protein